MAETRGDTHVIPITVEDLSSDVMRKIEKSAKSVVGGFDKLKAGIIALNQAWELFGRIQQKAAQAINATVGRAIELEKNVAEITTLLDDATGAQAFFTEEVLKLQAAYGTTQQDAAKAYYQALSSGAVDATNATDLLVTAQKLAIGGVTDLRTSVDGLTSVMNAYGISAENSAAVSDALFIGMKAGKTTIAELSGTLGQAATLAATTGVSFQELIGSVSAITTGGVDTANAVTQVRSAMVGLSKQTPQLQEVLSKLGITSIQTTVAQDGLAKTLRRIIGATGGTTEELTSLFGRIEAVNAILALTSDTTGKKFDDIMQRMGQSVKTMGETTDEAFNRIAATSDYMLRVMEGKTIARLTKIGLFIKDAFIPILISVMAAFNDIAKSIDALIVAMGKIDFNAIVSEAENAVAALGILSASLAVVFHKQIFAGITQMVALMKAFAVSAWSAVAPILVLSAKIIAITAIVTAAIAAIDIFAKNMDRLPQLAATIGDAFDNIGLRISRVWSGIVLGFETTMTDIASGLADFGLIGSDTLARLQKNAMDTADEFDALSGKIDESNAKLAQTSKGLDFGVVGQVVDQGIKAFERFNATLSGTEAAAKKAMDATALIGAAAPEAAGLKLAPLSDDDKKFLADIVSKTEDINAKLAERGRTEIEIINLQSQRQQQELAAFEEKLRLQNKMNDEAERQVVALRDAIEAQRSADVERARQEAGKRLAGPIADVGGNAAQIMGDVGAVAGGSFGEVMTTVSKEIMGFISSSAASVIGLLLQVPGIMDAFSGLMDQITNLPNAILKSFLKLGDALVNLISNFIPNLIQSVGDILMNAALFLAEKIPDAIVKLGEQIPAMLTKFVERLPEIAVKFGEALAKMNVFLLATRFIIALVKGIPKLIDAIVRSVPEIVQGFVDGFVMGIKQAINAISEGFGLGKIFNIDEPIEKLQELGENIQRSTSAMFQVIDLEASARGMDVADRIRSAINSSTVNAKNILQRLWKALEGIWIWVRDKILMPIWELITAAWQWVLDKVLRPIWDLVTKAWQWVWQNVIQPIFNLVKGAWDWVNTNIIQPLIQGLMSIWQWVYDKILKPWIDLVTRIFQWVADNIFGPITELLQGVFDYAKSTFDNIVGLFQTVFNFAKGVFENVVGLFQTVFNYAKSTFENVVGLFRVIFDYAKTIFDNIVGLFQGLWNAVQMVFDGIAMLFQGKIEGFKKIFDGIISGLQSVMDFFKKGFEAIGTLLKGVGEFYKKSFDTIVELLKGVADFFVDGFKNAAKLFEGVGEFFKKSFDTIVNLLKSVANFYQETFTKIIGAFQSLFDGLKDIFAAAIKPLKDILDGLLGVFDKAIQPIRDLFGGLNLNLSVPDWLKGIGLAVPDWLKGIGLSVPAWLNGISLNVPKIDLTVPTPSWLNKLKIDKPSWWPSGNVGGLIIKPGSDIGNKISDAWKKSDAGKMVSSGASALASGAKSISRRLGFAHGGQVPLGRYHNGELYAQGGAFAQGTDTVSANLTPGEFIVNRQATRANLGLLNFINQSRAPVSPVSSPTNISIVINTKTDLSPDQIRREVIPTLEREIKRKSMEGKWVLSKAGVR